jgi:hypothetical protein
VHGSTEQDQLRVGTRISKCLVQLLTVPWRYQRVRIATRQSNGGASRRVTAGRTLPPSLVKRMWFKALMRRSQTSRLNWNKFSRLLTVFPLPLPQPTIHQSWYGATG